MNMRTNVARIEEATHYGISETLEAIRNVDYGVRYAEDLREAVLREHREQHTEIDPRFCLESCQLAAMDW